ncbi:NRDE family protein [Ferdinandcohnia sp. Marseille-Q9671]
MCLVLFAYRMHPVYKVIMASNRDEFYQRPTAPIHFWEDHPSLLAGRDLEKKGTWMGVTKLGRFAALTNYRNPAENTDGKQSRGKLVTDALTYKGKIADYMKELAEVNSNFPGYNLLVGDPSNLYYYSNVEKHLKELKPGVHGLSNHLLDTEWPKVVKGKEGLSKLLNQKNLVERLLELLRNTDRPHDDHLPKTGVALEWERILSPLFIKAQGYGTRSSTILLLSDTDVHYVERVHTDTHYQDKEYRFPIHRQNES